uniref:MGT5A-like N-terminal domain-containing protein n=1 Tax=Urocitellus parryii TaxID=9999 RepID=A0A8D2GJN7_UROPR
MFFTISRKNMSQKLSLLLLVFGLIWGLMLLHYTFQQPRHQSSMISILSFLNLYVKKLIIYNCQVKCGIIGLSEMWTFLFVCLFFVFRDEIKYIICI